MDAQSPAEADLKTRAEAAHVLAMRAGAGDGVPQDFKGALDHCERAAELGHRLAQAELAALSGRWPLARDIMAGETLPTSPWKEFRDGIDPALCLATPRHLVLSANPRIGLVEHFASHDICDWLIARARPRLGPAKVYDHLTGKDRLADVRTNTECHFPTEDSDLVLLFLRERIATVTELPSAAMEATAILHYVVGQEFKPHHDYFDAASPGYAKEIAEGGQRVLTFLLCLNEDYDGAETAFPMLGKRFKGRKGNAIFFWNVEPNGAPDPRTQHAGLTPTRGEKWLLSQWIRGQVYRE